MERFKIEPMFCLSFRFGITLTLKTAMAIIFVWSWGKMIRREIREYLRLTSVKGIPRLLRTKSRCMQYIWGVSIVFFLSVAAYQATMLTKTYLTYSTVTSMRELPLDLTGQSEHSVHLPHTTFCNTNPFASNFAEDDTIPFMEQYITQVQHMTTCDGCTIDQKVSVSQLRDELMTSRGYYIQIGNDKAKTISHQVESLFASCHVWVMSGMHPANLPCDGFIEVELHQDSMFYNCFTIKPSAEQTKERIFMGIILVFHLDDYVVNKHPYVLPIHPHIGYRNGMMFAFHDRGTPPVLLQSQVLLQPGLFSDLKIRVKRRKRLPKPYGGCVEGAGEGNQFIKDGPYSQHMCFSLCRQAEVLDECGCIDYNNFVDVLSRTGERPCLKLEYGRDHLWKEWKCLQHAHNISAISCTDECPLPCDEVTFVEKVSTKWNRCYTLTFLPKFPQYTSHNEDIIPITYFDPDLCYTSASTIWYAMLCYIRPNHNRTV